MLLAEGDMSPKSTLFFSIIIATFNRPVMLARALESIITQDFKNFEVIVVNDGATDGYDLVLNKFSSVISKYLCGGITLGVSAARNKGILVAEGTWTIFLDDDDEFESGYFTYLHEYITKKNLTFAFLWCSLKHCVVDNEGEMSSSYIHFSESTSDQKQLSDIALTIGASYGLAVHREVYAQVGLFDSSYVVAEDTEFVIRMLKKNVTPCPLEKVGVIKYNMFTDSLSFDYSKYSLLGVYENIFYTHDLFLRGLPESYYKLLNWAAFIHFKHGNFSLGDNALRKMFFLKPFDRMTINYFIGGKVFKLSVKYPGITKIIKKTFILLWKKQ